MEKIKIIYWQDEGFWLGYNEQYPEYITQGMSLEELKENLIDLLNDIKTGDIPGVRKSMEIVVP